MESPCRIHECIIPVPSKNLPSPVGNSLACLSIRLSQIPSQKLRSLSRQTLSNFGPYETFSCLYSVSLYHRTAPTNSDSCHMRLKSTISHTVYQKMTGNIFRKEKLVAKHI